MRIDSRHRLPGEGLVGLAPYRRELGGLEVRRAAHSLMRRVLHRPHTHPLFPAETDDTAAPLLRRGGLP